RPLRRHASLTLQVSATTSRKWSALRLFQLRTETLRICGALPGTSTSFVFPFAFFFPAIPISRAPTKSGRASAGKPARLAILHCAYRVPNQRDTVKYFFPDGLFWSASRLFLQSLRRLQVLAERRQSLLRHRRRLRVARFRFLLVLGDILLVVFDRRPHELLVERRARQAVKLLLLGLGLVVEVVRHRNVRFLGQRRDHLLVCPVVCDQHPAEVLDPGGAALLLGEIPERDFAIVALHRLGDEGGVDRPARGCRAVHRRIAGGHVRGSGIRRRIGGGVGRHRFIVGSLLVASRQGDCDRSRGKGRSPHHFSPASPRAQPPKCRVVPSERRQSARQEPTQRSVERSGAITRLTS